MKSLLLACILGALALTHTARTSAEEENVSVEDAKASDSIKKHDFRPGAESHQFQAEVSRLMDILVHSLYSDKDIFLRELISNAADALDKVRFLSLTNETVLGDADLSTLPLEVKISVDSERGILSIRDTGIGMTRNDLMNNLGTIAKSGTAAFLEQMQKGGDINLIGQFGVGFYSAYLVADFVEVVTKHPDDVQLIWESSAEGTFAISEDKEGEPLLRGTQINLYLKDGSPYVKEAKLRDIVKRYSEFINHPISLLVEKEIEIEAEEEKEDVSTSKDDESKDGVMVEEEEEGKEDDGSQPKKVTKKVLEWETLNEAKALWLRPPGEVSEEEHEKFFNVLSKYKGKPLNHTHFKAEGDVEFRSVLYVPDRVPPGFYDNYQTQQASIKLYVRRVFVSDAFKDLLPRWLSFLVGLVDTDDMPLNVSREVLQQSSSLKVIRNKIVRKAIDMFKKMSDAAEAEPEDEESSKSGWLGLGKNKELEEKKRKVEEAKEKYQLFWSNYGKAIKLGFVEDSKNKARLLPLLRFQTTASESELTTLDAYISRMKENQTAIYYIVNAKGIKDPRESPFVEAVVEKGYEVILFDDPLDEYVMNNADSYKGKDFIDVSSDNAVLPKSEEEKEKEEKAQEHYKELTTWWKNAIDDRSISNVKVSHRLSTAPCVLVSAHFGWSAAMERIAHAQALLDPERAQFSRFGRILEVNPRHPLIRTLKEKLEEKESEEQLKKYAKTLYEVCLLNSGFLIDDPKDMNSRVLELLAESMGVDNLAPLDEEEYITLQKEDAKKDSLIMEGGESPNHAVDEEISDEKPQRDEL